MPASQLGEPLWRPNDEDRRPGWAQKVVLLLDLGVLGGGDGKQDARTGLLPQYAGRDFCALHRQLLRGDGDDCAELARRGLRKYWHQEGECLAASSRRVDDDVLAVRYQRHCICLDRHRRPEATVFELLQKLAWHCERTEKALPAVGAAIIRHCVEHDR